MSHILLLITYYKTGNWILIGQSNHLPLILHRNANLRSNNIFEIVPGAVIVYISVDGGESGELGSVTTPRWPALMKIKTHLKRQQHYCTAWQKQETRKGNRLQTKEHNSATISDRKNLPL